MHERERKTYTSEFKLKAVIESFQRDKNLKQVSQQLGIARALLYRWRGEFQTKASSLFADKRNPAEKAISLGYRPGESPDDLKKIISELSTQNEILKKVRGLLGN